MNDPRNAGPVPLARLLKQAAAELAAQPVPPLPPALLQALVGVPRGPAGAAVVPSRGWTAWLGGHGMRAPLWAGALAGLALVAGVGWFVLVAALPPRADVSRSLAAADDRFVPVVSGDRWVRLAGEGPAPAWLVQADVPREHLAAWGLPYDPARAAVPVRAELLLNPAGEVLALRVVHRPASTRPGP